MSPLGSVAAIGNRCVLCGFVLEGATRIALGLCDSCEGRPEAKRLALAKPTAALPARPKGTPRPFTAADKSLIRSIHHLTPAVDLLRLLNVRLIADVGAEAARYSMEQLQAEIATIPKPGAAAGDWSSLRRILAGARRSGVLERVTGQVIEDFAAVYQLSPAQLVHLKDVVRSAKEGR